MPPQDAQGGTTKPEKSIWSRSASPSGQCGGVELDPGDVEPDQVVLEVEVERRVVAKQSMQRTRSKRPCKSITALLRAAWCSRSTFWVTRVWPDFEPGDSVMRIVGQDLSEASPADHTARPVAAARRFLGYRSRNTTSAERKLGPSGPRVVTLQIVRLPSHFRLLTN
jgi:hypothetical protein